jgi:hypothetical protein
MNRALVVIWLLATVVGCGKKDQGRPEFGGKSAQAFYSGFAAKALDCDKPQAKIAHQRLNYNGRDYFDIAGGDEIDVYLYFLGQKFRMEFERTSYSYGGRSSVFKSASHDRESVTGDWIVQGKKMLLLANGKDVAEFGDGGPIDDHETMVGQVLPAMKTLVRMNVSEAISKPVRVIEMADDLTDQSRQSLACSGHLADAIGVH